MDQEFWTSVSGEYNESKSAEKHKLSGPSKNAEHKKKEHNKKRAFVMACTAMATVAVANISSYASVEPIEEPVVESVETVEEVIETPVETEVVEETEENEYRMGPLALEDVLANVTVMNRPIYEYHDVYEVEAAVKTLPGEWKEWYEESDGTKIRDLYESGVDPENGIGRMAKVISEDQYVGVSGNGFEVQVYSNENSDTRVVSLVVSLFALDDDSKNYRGASTGIRCDYFGMNYQDVLEKLGVDESIRREMTMTGDEVTVLCENNCYIYFTPYSGEASISVSWNDWKTSVLFDLSDDGVVDCLSLWKTP